MARTFTNPELERSAHNHAGRRYLSFYSHEHAIEIRVSRPLHGDRTTVAAGTTYEVEIGTGYTANDGGYDYEEVMWGEPLTGEDAVRWINAHTARVPGTKNLRLR